jgi:hypothetical protein
MDHEVIASIEWCYQADLRTTADEDDSIIAL